MARPASFAPAPGPFDILRALRDSEASYRTIFESASDGIWIHDLNTGEVVDVNPAAAAMYGYTREELLTVGHAALLYPGTEYTAERVVEYMGQAAAGDTPRFEWLGRHRNGAEVWAEVTLRKVTIAGYDRILVNARGIGERKAAERELREANEALERRVEERTAEVTRQKLYYEEVLNSLDAGVVVADPAGRFEYASASAIPDAELRRWVIGRTVEEYGEKRGVPESVIAERRAGMDRALETRSRVAFEQEMRHPDGSVRQMLRRIVPILDEAGEVLRLVAFSVDITDRKEAEIALQHAKEEAERANRAKSEFLSRMSHELRTPLNAILGFAQVLERKGLSTDHLKHLAHIMKGGKHLLRLINEVLELSRIEAGRLELSMEPVDVAEVVREAMDLVRPLANVGNHPLLFEVSGSPKIYALADRQRLSQVLINLLSNAIKYNRAGGEVRIEVEPSEGTVSIRVHDFGRGIPEERLGQLFTPFARLGAEQTETEGTGLGLALSRRLAEAMGGQVLLERTGAEGSVFRVDLRAAADPMSAAATVEPAAARSPNGLEAAATILYIEDNLTNLTLVETVLESKPNWTTISALRGEAGIELARERRPDVILLDLHLPDLPGSEVLRRLRIYPETAGIPIVIISADATGAAQTSLRSLGADEYLTKPLDLDHFLATVERFLPT